LKFPLPPAVGFVGCSQDAPPMKLLFFSLQWQRVFPRRTSQSGPNDLSCKPALFQNKISPRTLPVNFFLARRGLDIARSLNTMIAAAFFVFYFHPPFFPSVLLLTAGTHSRTRLGTPTPTEKWFWLVMRFLTVALRLIPSLIWRRVFLIFPFADIGGTPLAGPEEAECFRSPVSCPPLRQFHSK